MEYEQLEKGSSIITKTIKSQDIGSYVELLDPEVVLVTHFPYPESGPATAVVSEAVHMLHKSVNWERRTRQLLQAQAEQLAEQQKRYDAFLSQSRPLSDNKATAAGASSDHTNMATTATNGGNNAADKGTKTVKKDQTKTGNNNNKTTTTAQKQTQLCSSREPKGYRFFVQGSAGGGEEGGSYKERVDIVEGPTLVAERLCIILNWLNRGKYVAEVQTSLEPRKRILQDNDVLPPPEAPKTDEERFKLIGRQYTERNQKYSCLTLTYGRESLLFRDVCFFEEGMILTIHRYLVPLQEQAEHPQPSLLTLTVAQRLEKIKQSALDFYDGTSKSRINAVNHTLPMLDYSFIDADDPLKLLQTPPTAGKQHQPRGVRAAEDPRFAQGVFLNQANDPTANAAAAGQRTMIKAKNKRGEEEAYEFERGEGDRFAFMRASISGGTTKQEGSLDALVASSAASKAQYDASSVRVSSCGLGVNVDRLVPVLRHLVANALLTLTALDLSENKIQTIPAGLDQLPLQKLQLHSNKISDFNEFLDKVCPLPYLSFLTLHGNPIAENSEQYWPTALRNLLRHPNRRVKLKSLDFVILTAQDYNVAGAHDMFDTGDDALLQKAKTINTGGARREGSNTNINSIYDNTRSMKKTTTKRK